MGSKSPPAVANLWVASSLPSSALKLDSILNSRVKHLGSLFLADSGGKAWRPDPHLQLISMEMRSKITNLLPVSPSLQLLQHCLTNSLQPHLLHNPFISSAPGERKPQLRTSIYATWNSLGILATAVQRVGLKAEAPPKDMLRNRGRPSSMLRREGL